MSRSGRVSVPDVQEWSGNHPGCPGVVEKPSQMSGSVRKALSNVREALSNVWVWLGDSLVCTGVVGRPF